MFRRWGSQRRNKSQDNIPESPQHSQRKKFYSVEQRQYLAEVPYELPKDLEEINRLDFQHFMLRFLLKGNYVAPVRNPRNILDVGCGTGRWGMEISYVFPNARIVGVDMVPQLSVNEYAIPNYTFVQANLLEGLPFQSNMFDFVHQRLLVLGIPVDKWPSAVHELRRVTAPAGWVELAEPSCGFGAPAIERLFSWMEALSYLRNINVRAVAHIGELLKGAGLRYVRQHRVDIPVGEQGGRLGRMCGTDLMSIFKGIRGPIIGAQIASERDFDLTLARFQNELLTHLSYIPYFIAYGQKTGRDR